MRRLLVLLPLCAIVFSLTTAAQVPMPQSQVRDTRVTPTGPAEIHGRLLTEGDEPEPVRRAEVRATAAGIASQTTYTDADGRFVFRNLPFGRYTIEATRPGYVRSAYGARRYDRPGTPVTITDADRVHTLEWWMARGAVITGRILDEFGHPAQGGRVNVQQIRVVNGERTLVSVPMVSTILGEVVDDRGEYRLFGLPAGDYVISVMPRSIGTGDIRRMTDAEMQAARQAIQQPGTATTTPPPTTLGFSEVYFPGVLSSTEAATITVRAGEVRAGVDFNVRLVPTATLEGLVITPGGVAPESVRLSLTPKGGGTSTIIGAPGAATMVFTELRIASGGTQVNPDGTFTYGGVAPGSYTLNANVTRDGATPLWAATDVTVDGHTVSGLSLVLQEGLTVSGTLAFEADGVDPPVDVSRARLNFIPMGGGMVVMSPGATTVTESGFTARGLVPGPMRVIATFNTPEANWTLKSAVIKGRDVLDLPFVLEPTDTITDAVLTFTNQVQDVSGTLSDATNRPAPDFTIVVFPEDPALWSSTRRVRTSRPGTDGRFTITGLPSGRYRIAAVTDIGPEETRDLALLEELAAASIVFTLGDGERKVQDLRIAG